MVKMRLKKTAPGPVGISTLISKILFERQGEEVSDDEVKMVKMRLKNAAPGPDGISTQIKKILFVRQGEEVSHEEVKMD